MDRLADLRRRYRSLGVDIDTTATDAPVVFEYTDEHNPDKVIARRVDDVWLARRTSEILKERGKALDFTVEDYTAALRMAQAEGDAEVRRLGGDGSQEFDRVLAFDHAKAPGLPGGVDRTNDAATNNALATRVDEILAEQGLGSPTAEDEILARQGVGRPTPEQYRAALEQAKRERR